MSQKVDSFKLLASLLLCQLAGAIGSVFTTSSPEKWFLLLKKPVFSPPSWIFFRYGLFFIRLWGSLFILFGKKDYKSEK